MECVMISFFNLLIKKTEEFWGKVLSHETPKDSPHCCVAVLPAPLMPPGMLPGE